MSGLGPKHAVVAGSGLAGLTCARELARAGWRVTVVTPGRAGRDGASHRVHGLAPWILITAPCVRGDSPARYLADLQRRGAGLGRPGLDEVFAEESHGAAQRLREVLDLHALDDGPILLPGDDVPRGTRCLPRHRGPLMAPLLQECAAAGVAFRERTLVTGLLCSEERVAGVVALDRSDGGNARIEADAVVLACGGAGAVFPLTTSPRWCRGSAVALARAAGVLLHRAHLTQALPVTATPPLFFPTSAAILTGHLCADGTSMEPLQDLTEATLAIARELRRGATVELLVPLERASVLPRRIIDSATFSPEGAVPLTLALHHTLGGVAIDAWGRTSMPSLYACGEAAGGVQGARRTMGTGLLEAHVFGERAARAVISDIAKADAPRHLGAERIVPTPRDAAALEARLDEWLGPLVAMRPPEEVRAALEAVAGWPADAEAGGRSPEVALTSLRWTAAKAMLESQAATGEPTGGAVDRGGQP